MGKLGGISLGVIAFLGLIGVFLSMEQIDEGYRGVILRNGAFSRVAEPGLTFVNPVFDSVKEISIRTNSRLYEKEPFYSFDRQAADATVSVTYKLAADKVREVYASYGGEEGVLTALVDRRVKKELKEVLGTFTAATAIQERERLGIEVAKAMTDGIGGPILIESVQIEDVNFSDAYETSIENIMLADSKVRELEATKRQQEVQAEKTVIDAKAAADAVREAAQADAEKIKLKGDAQADAIRAKGKALAENPGLTALITAENWKGELPNSMVPGSAVPFINVDPK